MTEKRYIISHNGKEDGIRDKTNDKGYYGFELARLVNEVFNTVPLNEYEVEDEYSRKTIYVPNDIITEIYDKLKEKDLIK